MAGYVGALLIGLAVGDHRDPAVLAGRVRAPPPDRLPGRLVPGRAPRWLDRPVRRRVVVLRLIDAFQPAIVVFLAAIFIVAELTLSAERSELTARVAAARPAGVPDTISA